jgi:uncharacterized protein (TIGR02996 family)
MALDHLETARVAVAAGNFAAARDALVEAWRWRRSGALAALVDLAAGRAPDALTATLAGVVTGRVGTTLARVVALRGIEDPRVSGFAIATLSRLPFASPSALDLIRELLDRVTALGDSRLHEHRQTIASQISTRIKSLPERSRLQHRFEVALAAVRDGAELTADEAAIQDELVRRLAPGRTAETLLADIRANPDDDAPRLVLADLLLERGDPRGELIAMQLDRGKRPPSKREQELLAKHGKEWLGILAPVLGWRRTRTEFRRGFLAVADIIKSVDRKLMPLCEDPMWATVEELRGNWEASLLMHGPFRALRVIDRPLHPKLLEALALRADLLTRVRDVQVMRDVDDELVRAAFPNVQTIRTAARSNRRR